MRILIQKILREETLNEVKINKQSLLHDLQVMDFDYEDAKEEIKHHIKWFESLPKVLKLYRIIYADGENNINIKEPGKHYSLDKKNLLDYHEYSIGYGENKYLLTVMVNKSLVDPQETISNNILYPNEKEITLKRNGRGAQVIEITEL